VVIFLELGGFRLSGAVGRIDCTTNVCFANPNFDMHCNLIEIYYAID